MGASADCWQKITHFIDLHVVISQQRGMQNEDLDAQSTAHTVITTLKNNTTLGGACADVRLSEISADTVVFNEIPHNEITAKIEITEFI